MDAVSNYLDGSSAHSRGQASVSREARLEQFYAKLVKLGVNLDELRPILESEGRTLVLAGAGSGKTTALILRLIKDLITGDAMKATPSPNGGVVWTVKKIYVGTFLKSGATDLREVFYRWLYRLGIQGLDTSSITFGTLHSECYKLLKSVGVKVLLAENPLKYLRSSAEILSVVGPTSKTKRITQEDLVELEGLVAFYRNRLDALRYNHPLMNDFGLDTLVLDTLAARTLEFRRSNGVMDFEDMQELVYNAASTNVAVSDLMSNRYEVIYLDEFQDTSQIQWEILKHYIVKTSQVFAIGDDDQAIYSWRGSDVKIIQERFVEETGARITTLTTNYRCSQNILSAVIPSIERNSGRHEKVLRAANAGGVLRVVEDAASDYLVREIKKDVLAKRTVGVLSRTNQGLLPAAFLLELDGGIPFHTSKRVSLDVGVPRQVFGLMSLLTQRYNEHFTSYLELFVSSYSERAQARQLAGVLSVNTEYNLMTLPLDDLRHSVPGMYGFVRELQARVTEDGKKDTYVWLLRTACETAFRGMSTYATNARELIYFLVDLLETHPQVKDMPLDMFEFFVKNTMTERLRVRDKTDGSVVLSTVHEAKGKEYTSVYIYKDIVGSFPAETSKRALTQEEFEEERRLHYIAWTRAVQQLTVLTDSGRKGRFLQECNIPKECYVESCHESAKELSVKPSKTGGIRQWITVSLAVDGAKERFSNEAYYALLKLLADYTVSELCEKVVERGIDSEDIVLLDCCLIALASES